MEQSVFIKVVGNSPKMRVIDFFVVNSIFDYSKSEVAEATGLSRVTLDKIWSELIDFEVIKKVRIVGRATMYQLNKDSPIAKQLNKLELAIGRWYAENRVEDEEVMTASTKQRKTQLLQQRAVHSTLVSPAVALHNCFGSR